MLVTKRGYKKQYVIGGSGIFSSIAKFLVRMFASDTAKQLAKSALDVGKESAKSAATDVGKKLLEKAANKILTPKSQ